ncbi:MAG: hypothetical protein EP326_02245 [Deltaproteobacteria bacterium]|nr:MAG: hypothetical protein EP326_02245 [Deltaproteobacteria bacterium]
MAQILTFTLDFETDLEEYLSTRHPEVIDFRILSESLDARKANRGRRPKVQYRIEVINKGEKFTPWQEVFTNLGSLPKKPLIIGAGPAGLFCALRLAEYGVPSVIFERGSKAHERMKHIARFWRYGEFDSEDNVCFGEGGAGLFSDGKLITRVKSPYVQYVMNKFVDFGAPPETAWTSNPHLGSNKIRGLISAITDYLISKGCQIHYNTKVDELLYENNKIVGIKDHRGLIHESDHVILAVGHSASDMYQHLKDKNVQMEQKSFAVGVRVEHKRSLIDQIQYGDFSKTGKLGAARYRLSYEDETTKKGTYSFCMCPGGYVLSSGTEADGIVVNGMSNFARNAPWSNAALVVSVEKGKDFDPSDVLAGLSFQRSIEKKAYTLSCEKASGKEVPAQTVKSFLDGKVEKNLPSTSCPSKIFSEKMDEVLPEFIIDHLREALLQFEKKMPGFVSQDGMLLAPETRTSAPVTIPRDKETLESISHSGLYPCGEGAGYAGGITSAAVDGVKVAMSVLKTAKNFEV